MILSHLARPIARTRAGLARWWFPAIAPERLALLRILIGAWSLAYLGRRVGLYERIASGNPDDFEPVGVARWLHHAPIGTDTFTTLTWVTLAANALFVVGLGFRIIGPLFATLLLWLLCYRNSWSMIYHTDNLLVLHVIVLAAAPSARVLSIDALFRRELPQTMANRREQGAYGWPIMLICGTTACAYLLAGLAKLAGDAGFGWVSGEVLRSQILRDGIRKELLEDGAPALAYRLVDHLWILGILAFGSLLLELLAPLSLIHRRLGWLWCALVFPMHWGILLVMGILFRYQLYGFMFLPFLPIERIVPFVGSIARRGRPAVHDRPAVAS